MLRKLFAILVTVCLLAGCTAAPGETAPETAQKTIPETTQETTPETTQGMPPETTQETTPETTEADTRQYVYTDGACCYHIPMVELPGVNAGELNESLYETYDAFLRTEVLAVSPEEQFWLGLTYEIGRKDDVVSVTVLRHGDFDLDTYDVYYISASTGKELTREAVFAAFDMTEEDGEAAIRKVMETYWEGMGQYAEMGEEFFRMQKELTLADSNIEAVCPLITANGQLQFVGEFYSLAGADSYWYRFDPSGEFLQMLCQEHS